MSDVIADRPNTSPTNPTSPDKPTRQVIQFLKKNPHFFQQHPELLQELMIPHQAGSSVSLLERQASVLRQRNTELRHKLNELTSIGRDNDRLFGQLRDVGLALLEADSLDSLTNSLHAHVNGTLGLPHCQLFLFTPTQHSGKFRVTTRDSLEQTAGPIIPHRDIRCAPLRRNELQALFSSCHSSEGSAALIPLHFRDNLGLLALGSDDVTYFSSEKDTTLAGYLAAILSRRLWQLLDAD